MSSDELRLPIPTTELTNFTNSGSAKSGAKVQASTFGISFAESSISIEHYRKFEHSYFKIPHLRQAPNRCASYKKDPLIDRII